MNVKDLKRRDFLAKATLGTVGAATFISACSTGTTSKTIDEPPEMLDRAPDGKVIKAGLISLGLKSLTDNQFGVAYSTIRYRENKCVQ